MQSEWEAWRSCRDWLATEYAAGEAAGDNEACEALAYALEVVDRLGMNTLAAVPPVNRRAL